MRLPLSFAILVLVLATVPVPRPALADPVPEPDMKAAFIFNFAVFTEWPAETLPANAPLTVCARAKAALYPVLAQLADKVVNGHKVSIKPTPATLRDCHLLYLDAGDRERWAQLKRDLAGSAVLTVSDDRGIGSDGAVIFLEMENQRLAFDIVLGAARTARLNLSSKLLRLARTVQ
ncbi:YfiR family protein [Massilia arenosa]|uniref:YfiR family protein n=1 Tax=Zemynaea arenosa TaxID=2561931 RepID=A0A4Y9SJR5_9BURK|nr:YfiR family protein [Massilia arenosa]TFW25971.1 YfiR family protein [Massilia arenosa]